MFRTILSLLLSLTLCLSACAETYTPGEFVLRFGEVFFERAAERLENYDPSAAQTGTEPLDQPGGSAEEQLPLAEYGPADDVITFDGGSVKLGVALAEYEEMVALYEEFGMDASEYADDLKDSVLAMLAEEAILEMKAKELGVYENTPVEQAAAEEEALYWYEDNLEYYKSFVYDESLSDEELTAMAEELMAEDGVSYENILKDTLYMLWSDRLYEAVTAEVTVSEEYLQELYETGVSDAMELYSDDPEMFEYDYSYGMIFYRPTGFREVVYMELPYTDEEYDMTDEERLASLTERCGDIIARAQDGEDIMELVSQTECYDFGTLAISENSTLMGEVFTAAAMALADGETSQPIPGDYGAWIIRCNGEIESGEVPMEEIYDMLAESALESARADFYYQLVQQWMDEANIVYHPEMLP